MNFTKLEHSTDGIEDVLILTEVFTKPTVAIVTKDQSCMSVVKVLLKEWIPTTGFLADSTPTMPSALRLKL